MPNQFQDPREIVTPDAFTVAPELLGLPLARPARRLAAMLLDLLLVFLLVRLGGFVLFVVAAAWMFFRMGGRSAGSGLLRRSWRLSFRFTAALVLLLALVLVWNSVRSRVRVRTEPPRAEAVVDAKAEAEDAEAARAAMAEVVARLQEQGVDPGPLRAVMDSLRREAEVPESPGVPANPDSLALLYAEAVAGGDSATVATLRPRLAEALAGERISTLESRISTLERSNRRLRNELDEAREERGILSFLRVAADELGLGFGWIGLYFTAFTTLWRGQTPGKRLLGMRVLRLDGKPIGWWASFERFGGYAASVLTGLLGFAQMLWDRNRQALHDKISETVVVRL